MLHADRFDRSLLASANVRISEKSLNGVGMLNLAKNRNIPGEIKTTSSATTVQSTTGSAEFLPGDGSLVIEDPPSPKVRKRRLSAQSSPIPTGRSSLFAVKCAHNNYISATPATTTVSKQTDFLISSCSASSSSRISTNTSPSTSSSNDATSSIKLNGFSSPDARLSKTVTFSLEQSPHNNLSLVKVSPASLRPTSASNQEKQLCSEMSLTDTEVNNLKGLVLLHLDLVQQQQTIIAEKDRLISELRTESNMLKIRLERMDRRLAVKKTVTRKEPTTKTSAAMKNTELASGTKSAAGVSPSTSRQLKNSHQEKTQTKKIKYKKRLKTEPEEEDLVEEYIPKPKSSNKSLSNTKKQIDSSSANTNKKLKRLDGLLRIGDDYYTQQVREYEELVEEIIPNSHFNQNIEVPSYRLQTFNNSYHLEGTEDIDDQTFLKRHLRHENDEKKRKRWDLQRQRERQVIDKLKQTQSAAAAHKQSSRGEKLVGNIFPLAEHAEFIEICDHLPVNVFGHPLPSLPPSEFSLPWYKPSSAKPPAKKRGRKRTKQ